MRGILAAAVLFASMIGFAHAQDMSAMMAPAPEMKAVEFLMGEFKGTANFSFGGEKTSGPCSAKSAKAMTDHFIQTNIKYTMKLPGMPDMVTEGMHLLTYDPQAKQYVSWWFDSMATNSMHLTGKFEGDKLVMVSEPTDIPGMGKVVMRSSWWKAKDNSIGSSLEMQQGDKWVPMMETELKKS